jgi:putative addiction module component (TIGR02574 family)
MSQSSLSPDIRQLPVPERVQLVELIWDSIAEDEKQFQLTEAQQAELDRRLSAQETDPGRGSPWQDVRKKLSGDE